MQEVAPSMSCVCCVLCVVCCVLCAGGVDPGVAAKAEALEGSLASTKDQLLRLTADFENFRKRTVCAQLAPATSGHHTTVAQRVQPA